MKRCPRCGQTYAETDINFCLNDGELLSRVAEEPPTVIIDPARKTAPNAWETPYNAPMQQWQGGGQAAPQFAQMQATQNQTLALLSLIFGIASLVVGWCCSLGLLLSPAAVIMGIIAMSQIKRNPDQYTGRGLAIAGIVTGSVFLALYILFIIIYGLAIIGGNIG
ncbi:MAG: DUF4190 domain-containing protein [Pyrinomonadaceae bacterium]|nr:DUF4190 domain-containing protein [Pyrinomonadaceae bacterium]